MRQKCHVAYIAFLLTVALGGCSRPTASGEAERPATSTNSGMNDLCGQKDDGKVHLPPALDSFAPPSQGTTYRDPQYGCNILRLTNSKAQLNLAIHHQYSTIDAVNDNDTRVMLLTEWGQGLVTDMS